MPQPKSTSDLLRQRDSGVTSTSNPGLLSTSWLHGSLGLLSGLWFLASLNSAALCVGHPRLGCPVGSQKAANCPLVILRAGRGQSVSSQETQQHTGEEGHGAVGPHTFPVPSRGSGDGRLLPPRNTGVGKTLTRAKQTKIQEVRLPRAGVPGPALREEISLISLLSPLEALKTSGFSNTFRSIAKLSRDTHTPFLLLLTSSFTMVHLLQLMSQHGTLLHMEIHILSRFA